MISTTNLKTLSFSRYRNGEPGLHEKVAYLKLDIDKPILFFKTSLMVSVAASTMVFVLLVSSHGASRALVGSAIVAFATFVICLSGKLVYNFLYGSDESRGTGSAYKSVYWPPEAATLLEEAAWVYARLHKDGVSLYTRLRVLMDINLMFMHARRCSNLPLEMQRRAHVEKIEYAHDRIESRVSPEFFRQVIWA